MTHLDPHLLHISNPGLDDHEGHAGRGLVNGIIGGVVLWALIAVICWAVFG